MLFSDLCGLLSVLLIYTTYVSLSYLAIFLVILPLYPFPTTFSILFLSLSTLSFLCHLSSMLLNPGYILPSTLPLLSQGLRCEICQITKIPRTHHCLRCNKCVLNMDHHCQWINNCVGFKNQKHFILFLVYTLILCSWYLGIVSHKMISVKGKREESKEKVEFERFLMVCSGIWGFFFWVLCAISLKEQIWILVNNISVIDVLQGRKFVKRPLKENFEEVFGGNFGIGWFFPVPIKTQPRAVEVIEDLYMESIGLNDPYCVLPNTPA